MKKWKLRAWLHAIWIILFVFFQICSYFFNRQISKKSLLQNQSHAMLKYSFSTALIICAGPAWLKVVKPIEQEPLLHLLLLAAFMNNLMFFRPFLAIAAIATIGWIISQLIA